MKKDKPKKLQTVELTREEWLAGTRPNVYRNKKKYRRKEKHKGRRGY